jgi:hypothetical protein
MSASCKEVHKALLQPRMVRLKGHQGTTACKGTYRLSEASSAVQATQLSRIKQGAKGLDHLLHQARTPAGDKADARCAQASLGR